MRTAVPADVPDELLDEYIAQAIIADAHDKNSRGGGGRGHLRYARESVALTSRPGRAASTNKRFLASMIRNVDSHNQRQIHEAESVARDRERDRCRNEQRHDERHRRRRGEEFDPRRPGEESEVRRRGASRWDTVWQPYGYGSARTSRFDAGRPARGAPRAREDDCDARSRHSDRSRSGSPMQLQETDSEDEIGPVPARPVRQWDVGKDTQ